MRAVARIGTLLRIRTTHINRAIKRESSSAGKQRIIGVGSHSLTIKMFSENRTVNMKKKRARPVGHVLRAPLYDPVQ